MFFDEEKVRSLLRMKDLIPAMADAMRELSAGQVEQPVRLVLPVAEHKGFFGVMPAFGGGALGAKLVTFYPNNEGIPTHHAMILLFRPETGEPLVTMDGRLITEMRTAAVSAVATDLLARREGGVLAILGSGVQAQSHLEALRLVRQFSEVRVWSPRRAGRVCGKVRGDGGRHRRGSGPWSGCRRGRNLVDKPGAERRMGFARRAYQRGRRDPAKLAGTG